MKTFANRTDAIDYLTNDRNRIIYEHRENLFGEHNLIVSVSAYSGEPKTATLHIWQLKTDHPYPTLEPLHTSEGFNATRVLGEQLDAEAHPAEREQVAAAFELAAWFWATNRPPHADGESVKDAARRLAYQMKPLHIDQIFYAKHLQEYLDE